MDALTALNEHIDMYKILEHYDFDKIHENGSMIRSCCKLHGGNNPSSFVVNTRNNLWYCHTGNCGGGDIYTLVQRMEECSFKEAVRFVAHFFSINIDDLEIQERKAIYVNEMKKWVKVMKQKTKTHSNEEYQVREETRKVTKFRNFRKETLEHFGLSHIAEIHLVNRDGAPYVLRNRLVFPIIQKGIQVGVSLRRIKSSDVPKWSHQPVNMETKELLYNYDAVHNVPRLVICEGIVDVWAYYEIGVPAVATFGAHVTEEQYRLLMRTGAELVWSFDGDEAGRNATEKAIALFRKKADQYIVHFEDGQDPASISREELMKLYGEKERIV